MKTACIIYTGDVNLVEPLESLKGYTVKKVDVREPLSWCDLNIHFEIPVYGAIHWAHQNVLFVNPEKWSDVYDAYVHAFDALIFNDPVHVENFRLRYKGSTICTISDLKLSENVSKCVRPPVLRQKDCPPITVITPTRGREKLIEIAFHNLLATDYPHDKIEWVVIEDNEDKNKMYSEKIISFQIQTAIQLKYIPIEGVMSIGEKRNIGVENASNDVILFMDDDDHYPITSFRRRVAWLLDKPIACCTTIAMYDLQFGTSAVNVPPYNIPLGQRISEATLTFKKSAWLERKFLDVSISEGEMWIAGREDQVVEMPPQQIIIAFTHGNNKSGRSIPSEKPGCFWGFPKEYLEFIHGLV